jgi:hypothetical protein
LRGLVIYYTSWKPSTLRSCLRGIKHCLMGEKRVFAPLSPCMWLSSHFPDPLLHGQTTSSLPMQHHPPTRSLPCSPCSVLPLCLVLASNHIFIFIRPRVMQYLLIDRRPTGPGSLKTWPCVLSLPSASVSDCPTQTQQNHILQTKETIIPSKLYFL